MKNVNNSLGVKNISDLVLKEIYGRYGTKNATNKQIRRYKMTEWGLFENCDNLDEYELNTKNNK